MGMLAGYGPVGAFSLGAPLNSSKSFTQELIYENGTATSFSVWLDTSGNQFSSPSCQPSSPRPLLTITGGGKVVIGAYDTSSYLGSLTVVEAQSMELSRFGVVFTSLLAISSSGSDKLGQSHVLPFLISIEIGTALTYLPISLAAEMWAEVGAIYSPDEAMALVSCRMQNSSGYFQFGFGGPGGPVINISMSELVLPTPSSSSSISTATPTLLVSAPIPSETEPLCIFGVQNSSSDFALGQNFLRSAYIVINDPVAIAMAQSNPNATTTNYISFTTSGTQIPSATTALSQPSGPFTTPNPTLSAPSSTSYAASAGFISPNATRAISSSPSNGTTSGLALKPELSIGAEVGIAVSVSVVTIVVITVVVWFCLRNHPLLCFHKRRHPAHPGLPELHGQPHVAFEADSKAMVPELDSAVPLAELETRRHHFQPGFSIHYSGLEASTPQPRLDESALHEVTCGQQADHYSITAPPVAATNPAPLNPSPD